MAKKSPKKRASRNEKKVAKPVPISAAFTSGLEGILKRAGLRQAKGDSRASGSDMPRTGPKEARRSPKRMKSEAKAKSGSSPSAKSKSMPVSPLAPARFPIMPPVAGLTMKTAAAKVYYAGREDLLAVRFEPETQVAGMFTKSKTAAAPVVWCQGNLAASQNKNCQARALVVNSGNANAFTGRAGHATVKTIAASAAKHLKSPRREVFVASTGVIGESFPGEKIAKKLPSLLDKGSASLWESAARAIMTTDTFPKGASRIAEIDGESYVINGIAKGSGMIAPNMATMLAFVFTDAAIPSDVLQTLLFLGVRDTFNAITVDSDTSTSDTVLLFATGRGPEHAKIERAADRRLRDFREKLHDVLLDLAQQVVRDGEGASKFVTVTVNGATTAKAARVIALSVANSPLVKTAIAGEDPNWGRVVMAVGKSGEAADRDKMKIEIGGLPVARNGEVDPKYSEKEVAKHMSTDSIALTVDVGVGTGASTVWTCDLTHQYISINADYRS
jgi:glutamate N-acetyltransferase/amino-acid N-acetyltransferase